MPWASIAASVAGSVISSSMQSDSAGQAVNAQQQGTDQAVAEQRRQYDQTRTDLAPYRNTGNAANQRLASLLGLTQDMRNSMSSELLQKFPTWLSANNGDQKTLLQSLVTAGPDILSKGGDFFGYTGYGDQTNRDLQDLIDRAGPALANWDNNADEGSLNKKFTLADFWDDPVTKASYQQGLDQGTKALTNMAGARGNLNSGAQLKALTRFSTDYTGGQAAGSQARYVADQTNTYNRLAGLSGTGQMATANGAQMGQNSANTISGLMAAQGNARGAAAIAGGNAMAGGFQNVANNYQQQSMLDKIIGNRGGSSGGGYSVYNDPSQNYGGYGGGFYDYNSGGD